jgi:hypothetical protein
LPSRRRIVFIAALSAPARPAQNRDPRSEEESAMTAKPKGTPALALALAAAVALAACGKAQDAASEKAAEKMIESAMNKDGSTAKVDLAGGSMKITTTDATGKTATSEFGAAKVSEADLGVPFYPGTKLLDGGSTKVSTPSGDAYTVQLHTDDAPDKVSAFYRDKLKAQSAGKQFMDMASGDGNATLMLADDKTKSAIQVHVMKAEKGADIQIVAHREAAK